MSTIVRRVCHGSVDRVVGSELEIRGLRLGIGDAVDITTAGHQVAAEIVAVEGNRARALVYGDTAGLAPGARVQPRTAQLRSPIGDALLGRIVDGLGRPIDGLGPIRAAPQDVRSVPVSPLARQRIRQPLSTGVRVIDTLCTVGRGQRLGLFAGSGVGKSTLLAMMVRGTDADRSVIALIGERGREVREFVEDVLGPEGLATSVVVVATSDEPALLRSRAAMLATRIAEWFADAGHDVLLTMDSITRFAAAQREIGLAAGEPPTTRGYPPSAFASLPRLLERAGPRAIGSITAFYTVLVEGDDHDEPIADATRAILDGHIVLDRQLANQGRYPAVNALASVSRLASVVSTPEQIGAARTVRAALAAWERVAELVDLGAYVAGADPLADAALAAREDLTAFLQQNDTTVTDPADSWDRLFALASTVTPGPETP